MRDTVDLKAADLKTAVFVSELREDLGFASPLLAIAGELVRLGAQSGYRLRTIFAVADPVYCGHELASLGHEVIPAPPVKTPFEVSSFGRSYANLLSVLGFGHERELGLLVGAWDRLFSLTAPDFIVTDNSPVACLAARGKIPNLVVGSGFSVPPLGMGVFPSIFAEHQTEVNQAVLLEVVNRVLVGRRAPPVATLPHFLSGDMRAVFTLPQLDPYHGIRTENVIAPPVDLTGQLSQAKSPSVFCALPSTFPHLIGVARALERVGADASAFLPGPRTVGSTLMKQSGVRVFDERPKLSEVLPNVSVVLAGSADAALCAYLAGRPQVVLRGDLETSIMAKELKNRNTALTANVGDVQLLASAIRELLDDRSYALSALEEARRARAGSAAGSQATAMVAKRWLDVIGISSRPVGA